MKKYKVFPEIVLVSILMFCATAISLYWLLGEGEIGYAVMMVLIDLPFTICFYLGWATIIFNEKGIQKRFLGIKIKKILWTELQDVKILYAPSGQKWIFFSKKPLYNYGLSRCRVKLGVLYLAIRGNMMEEISSFLPPNITIRNNN